MIPSALLAGLLLAPPPLPPALPAPRPTLTARPGERPPGPNPGAAKTTDATTAEPPIVTHHSAQIGGKTLDYTATAGMMPLKSSTGEPEAQIFYIAYTLDSAGSHTRRPLMFAFNGGPGAASVWLHLGAIGPRRVKLLPDGHMPPPPFQLVDNESSWLDQTDLVFIDPVGTGYSQAVKPEDNRRYWGVQQDIESLAEFIRMYLTRNDRWDSPLFLVGESYGTFRGAGLAGNLIDKGIALDGVILVSTVLNFRELSFGSQDDVSYISYLPTYTAAAWYHKKLSADLERRPLPTVLAEAEKWASGPYAATLSKGDGIPAQERRSIIDGLARFTGLSKQYIGNSDLRIEAGRFRKELLRDEKLTIGRYDSRITGVDLDNAGGEPEYDPSEAAVKPPFTMTFNSYIRTELGYKSDRLYKVLTGLPWDFGGGMGYPSTTEPLSRALAKNPYLKVLVAMGYYDLATPYYSVEDTLSHLGLSASLHGRIVTGKYEAGHMMYIDSKSRAELKRNAAAFIQNALASGERQSTTSAQ